MDKNEKKKQKAKKIRLVVLVVLILFVPLAVAGVILALNMNENLGDGTIVSLTLTVGESAMLTASFLPRNSMRETVSWTSSDESVVTVNPAGFVIAAGLIFWDNGVVFAVLLTVLLARSIYDAARYLTALRIQK